ncbi:AMP-binding protein [Sphingomonas arenae]|uniref:AMP-binding protein n=1 Tax=Sphingomonas arenae TaxID=2812555 RepID=UPI00196776C3
MPSPERPDYVDRFLRVAAEHPEAVAIRAGKTDVRYAEFEQLVRRYAQVFVERGADRVLLALPPGVDVYAAILGSGLAGCTHTPLNLASPPEKAVRIVDLLQPTVIVGDDLARSLADTTQGAYHLAPSELPEEEYRGTPRQGHLAYILFTSGSTGLPKGVMVPRAALNHYVGWLEQDLACGPGDRVSQHPSLAFDISMTDIFGALCFGATLVPLMNDGDRLLPARFIARQKITVWNSTPSVMSLIMQAGEAQERFLSSVRLFNFCGEPLLPVHLEAIFAARPDVLVHNTYGPTEATISVTNMKLRADDVPADAGGSVSIGPAIEGMALHLVGGTHPDEGEIVISGPQLADGYLQDSAKTAERFRELEVEGQAVRGYFTGDWAERRDGLIYFKERIDFQVKIRGHRIEMDEVGGAIRNLGWPMVVVFPVSGNDALAAVVERVEGRPFDEQKLRRDLAAKLEPYAVPQHIRLIERLPRNESDKIDRRATIDWFAAQD